jgi:hypothetical protein
MWPQLVMHQSRNLLPSCKLDAVTAAAVNACDGVIDGIIGDPRRCTYDPNDPVGTRLGCGVFTTADADVVAKIWEGPRSSQGSFTWYGLERGAPLDVLADQAGPFPIPDDWIRFWVLENPDWDYRTATNSDFETMFQRSHAKFNELIGTGWAASPNALQRRRRLSQPGSTPLALSSSDATSLGCLSWTPNRVPSRYVSTIMSRTIARKIAPVISKNSSKSFMRCRSTWSRHLTAISLLA